MLGDKSSFPSVKELKELKASSAAQQLESVACFKCWEKVTTLVELSGNWSHVKV